MRVLRASGSPREIGRTIGSEAADLVRGAIELICRFELPRQQIDERLAAVEATLAAVFPHVLEEAEGVAEGAGVSRRDALSLSLCSDLSGKLPSYCSLAAVPSRAGTLVGKNLDTSVEMGPLQVLERIEPEDGLAFAHVTTAGAMWTDGGVNETGLALVNASVSAAEPHPDGVPDGILIREVLRSCADVPAAIRFLGDHEVRTLGENVLLADAAGRSAVVEKLPGGHAVRPQDEHGSVAACNHVLAPTLAGRAAADDDIRENSLRRLERLEAERRRPGDWTAERLLELLVDARRGVHQDGADGIWTVASIVLAPLERRLSVIAPGDGVAEVTLDQTTPAPGGPGGKEESNHGEPL